VTNYEVGLKTKLFDNRLRLNTAAFFMDYSNLQIVQFLQASDGEPTSTTTNAAKAHIRGIEFEGQWQVTGNDRISGFLNWLDARYIQYRDTIDPYTAAPVASLDGNQLINAPDVSARGEYAHSFGLGDGATLTPSATVYWQATSYLREFNLPIDRVPAYAKLDGNLVYESADGTRTVQAYVHNATNKLVRDSANVLVPGTYLSDFEPPRTYGIRASYKF
jgi:iron complex outermembrane recepter protein